MLVALGLRPYTCRGCNEPQDVESMLLCYQAAKREADPEARAAMTLDLCHSLILSLANHEFCMHGKARETP